MRDQSALSPPPFDAQANALAISRWLLACAGLVFAMAVIGAITRLTESGLSIVDWRPVTGAIPPLTQADWIAEFAKYQDSPQYRLRNVGMSLDDFKAIFFWEWLHRLWGRLIGVAFLVPLVWFWVRRRIPAGWGLPLVGLFLLGGAQGGMGWYMVMSGLVDRPEVSHYRLAAHLGLAVTIYAALLAAGLALRWQPCPIADAQRPALRQALRRHAMVAQGLVGVTLVWGAFVAGLDAGLAYNEWPLMNGSFAPPELWTLTPWWQNLLDNAAAVQFSHRWLAMTAALVVLALAARAWQVLPLRRLAIGLAVAIVAQVGLGISTLLLQVPTALAATHQAGALVVVGLLIAVLVALRPPARND